MKAPTTIWKALIVLVVILAGLATLISFKSSVMRTAPAATPASTPALTITPAIAAGKDDLFEDVTTKAGIGFVNQYCDSRIANILESAVMAIAVQPIGLSRSAWRLVGHSLERA